MWQTYLAAGLFLGAMGLFICCSLFWLVKTVRSGKFKDYPIVLKYWHNPSYVRQLHIGYIGLTALVGFATIIFFWIAIEESSPGLWIGGLGSLLFFWAVVVAFWYIYGYIRREYSSHKEKAES